jgi:hypothetical protein
MDGTPFDAKPIAAEYLRQFDDVLRQVDLDAVDRVFGHLRASR